MILIDVMVCLPQVFTRLQKLLICMSHKRTIAYLEKVGETYDAPVCEWRASLLKTIPVMSSQV